MENPIQDSFTIRLEDSKLKMCLGGETECKEISYRLGKWIQISNSVSKIDCENYIYEMKIDNITQHLVNILNPLPSDEPKKPISKISSQVS